jgi:hypothetical protein
MALHVRELTAEEHAKLGRLAHAQTAPVRLARRARSASSPKSPAGGWRRPRSSDGGRRQAWSGWRCANGGW